MKAKLQSAPKLFGMQLPYGTLIVNVAGGFLIGLIMELSLGGVIAGKFIIRLL